MYYPPDGPAVVRVNIFVRSISKIDDVTMVSARNIKLNNNKINKKKSKIKSLPSKNRNNNSKKKKKKKREILFGLKTNTLQPWLRPCPSKCSTVRVCLCMWLCIAEAIPAICVPLNFQIQPTLSPSPSLSLFLTVSLPLSLSLSLFILSGCFSISRTYSYNLCIRCQFYV